MLKKNTFYQFIKRNVAFLLAVIMALSAMTSAGLAINTAYAAPVNDNGEALVANAVKLATTTPKPEYVWGAWGPNSFDCRGFVRYALAQTYGMSVTNTEGYLVDDAGNALDRYGRVTTDPSKRVKIDIAAYDPASSYTDYVGKRVCVEGNGRKTYFKILCADKTGRIDNTLDIPMNGTNYSSIIAYACQFPGTIIHHNGHVGMGLGAFHSKADALAKYPALNDISGGSNPGPILRWLDNCYNYGQNYAPENPKYWFGKTLFLSACSPEQGVRVDNYTTAGKDNTPDYSSALAIFLCESKPAEQELTLNKVDVTTKEPIAGAEYKIYSDPNCKNVVATYTSNTTPTKIKLKQGVYYLKETKAPDGYELSPQVIKIDLTNKHVSQTLFDNPVNGTVLVRKIDQHDPTKSLPETTLWVQEYQKDDQSWRDLVQLKYNSVIDMFEIATTYESNGKAYDDHMLHYTKENDGKFKIVETSAQDGYINNGWTSGIIDLKPQSNGGKAPVLIYNGKNAATNQAKLSLLIKKTDIDGQPLEGAEFVFKYNSGNGVQDYTGRTNAKGELLFENIPEGPTLAGRLIEVKAPDGYEIANNYKPENGGQPIMLEKNKVVNGSFQTKWQVRNKKADTPLPPVKDGQIVIHKNDGSRLPIPPYAIPGVADTYYTVYADADLTTIAQDKNGKVLENLKTDAQGDIVINNLAMGNYFIKEVEPSYGYAIQTRVFQVQLNAENVNAEGIVIGKPFGVSDARQNVVLQLEKKDELTGAPLENAVFALYSRTDLIATATGETIPADTLLGYYKTNADGKIMVSEFGSAEFDVNGKHFEKVYPEKMMPAQATIGSVLPNGKYDFVEVMAPEGYELPENTSHVINADWVVNKTADTVTVEPNGENPGGSLGPAGRTYTLNPIVVNNSRKTMTIELIKTDAEHQGVDVNGYYYQLTNYDAMVAEKLAATLQNANYQLFNKTDLVDVNTGATIPANTSLGIYNTDADGKIVITAMNNYAYDGHALPIGDYQLVEIDPPQGYELDSEVIDVTYDGSSVVKVSASDKILKQSLTITKTDENKNPVKDAEFMLYNVAKIKEHQDFDPAALTRESFETMVQSFNLTAEEDSNGQSKFVSDAQGKVTTGLFVYGDYILYESKAPAGYKPAEPVVVQLPSVPHDVAGGAPDGSTEEGTQPDISYTHDVSKVPVDEHGVVIPFEITVVNTKEEITPPPQPPQDDTISITVKKVWDDENNKHQKRPDSVEVRLFADGVQSGNEIILSATNNWEYTWKNLKVKTDNGDVIDYTVKETEVPDYTSNTKRTDNIFTITNTCTFEPLITNVYVTKYETVGTQKQSVAGAKLQILSENGKVVTLDDGTVLEWITGNETETDLDGLPAKVWKGLVPGNYILREVEAPKGYLPAKDVQFVVTESADPVYVSLENQQTLVEINKVDATSGTNVVGAKLTLLNDKKEPVLGADGTEIQWVTDTTAHSITGLAFGQYYVRELETPVGYQKSEDVQFNIDAQSKHVTISMSDERTFGKLTLHKTDKDTGKDMKDVEFEFISKNDVVDQITGEKIYSAGEVLETLVTDKNGQATTAKTYPIGTYNQNGFVDYIEYALKETKAPAGQYDKDAVNCDVIFTYINDQTPVIEAKLDIQNIKPIISVSKYATPNTYVGDTDEPKQDVTIVKHDDIITYTIEVKNTGAATAWNVVVKDQVPAGTEFVKVVDENGGFYDTNTNTVYWNLDKVTAGSTTVLSFETRVSADLKNKAEKIVNVAYYAIPEQKPESDDQKFDPTNTNLPWIQTNYVVHQTIALVKSSQVPGGATLQDAVDVAQKETIEYKIEPKIVCGDLSQYMIAIKDVIPSGLTYVNGSAKVDGVQDTKATYNPKTREIEFSKSGSEFTFKVTVDEIPNNEKVEFVNRAQMLYSPVTNNTEKQESVMSNAVTHKTSKSITAEKFVSLNKETDHHDNQKTTPIIKNGDDVIYTIVVKNNKVAPQDNIVVVDKIPEGLEYVSHTKIPGVTTWVDKDTQTITWRIDRLTDEPVSLKFIAKSVANASKLFVNVAEFGQVDPDGNKKPDLGENKEETNDVKVQQLEFHKVSQVPGGHDKTDAQTVSVGDTITYYLSLNTKGNAGEVVLKDTIPDGLEFVPGSAQILTSENETWQPLENIAPNKDRMLLIPIKAEKTGGYIVSFEAKVQSVKLGEEKFFLNQATLDYERYPGVDGTPIDTITSEIVSHTALLQVSASKQWGNIPTYQGAYENRDHVAVVQDGETIDYAIDIKNIGKSILKNVVIKDPLQKHSEYVKADENGVYDKDNNVVSWVVEELKPNETKTVHLTIKVDTNHIAAEIRNKAYYAVPEDKDNIKDDEWMETDEVIYQTVVVSKASSIKYGTDKKDAPYVAIGNKFDYTIVVESVDDLYSFAMKDMIPSGLTFTGNASYKLSDGKIVKVNDLKVKDGELVFPMIEHAPAGKTIFTFTVSVDDIKAQNKDVYFLNTAIVKFEREDEKTVELITNTVSHKTIKSDKPNDPVLGFDGGNESVVWAAISVVSAMLMGFCLYYGFSKKKHKK